MAAIFPAQQNTFIPSHEESNRLVVDFSRNPDKFTLNQYIQIVPVEKPLGYYLKMTVEERMRITTTTLTEHLWADSNDAPNGSEGKESFEFLPFACTRYAYAVNVGYMSSDNASWDMLGQYANIRAQQAMTARTQLCLTALTTTGNYGSNYGTATAAGGGKWDVATTSNLYIKKGIDYAVKAILKATGAVVTVDDLQLVVGPDLAAIMAESQEIADFVKGSPFALGYIRGDIPGKSGNNRRFGLPETYAGVRLVVEDCVKVTSRKGASSTSSSFMLAATSAFITARPGGLVGTAGGPSFSTATLFVYNKDDMSVETRDDVDNRRRTIRVVDTIAPVVTAGSSGYLFTSVTG